MLVFYSKLYNVQEPGPLLYRSVADEDVIVALHPHNVVKRMAKCVVVYSSGLHCVSL